MDSSSIKGKEVAMNRDTYIEKGGKTRKGEKEKNLTKEKRKLSGKQE